MTTASAIDAEDVAALCLIEADGDLAISCADLADLPDDRRRARAGSQSQTIMGRGRP